MRTRLPIHRCIQEFNSEKDIRIVDRDVEEGLDTYYYELDVSLSISDTLSKGVSNVTVTIQRDYNKVSRKIIDLERDQYSENNGVSAVKDATTIEGLTNPESQEDPEKSYSGYLKLENTSILNVSRIASILTTSIQASNQNFFEKKSLEKKSVISTHKKDPKEFIDKKLQDYAFSNSSRYSSKKKHSKKGAGLTSHNLPRKKRQIRDISQVVSEREETVLMKASSILEDRKISKNNLDTGRGLIQMTDTILVEGIQRIKNQKQGIIQEKEYERSRLGGVIETKISSNKKIGKNPVSSNLRAQIERGEKSLVTPAVSSFRSASWSTISLLKKTPASILQSSLKNNIVFSSENYAGVVSRSQKSLPITKTEASYASLLNRRFSNRSKSRKNILDTGRYEYMGVQIRKKYKNFTIPVSFSVKNSDISNGVFCIKIRAYNSSGQIIDSKKIRYNHNDAIQGFYTTSEPPIFSGKIDDSGEVVLSVKQVDKDADSLKIYKKYISKETFYEGTPFVLLRTLRGKTASEKSEMQTIIDDSKAVNGSLVIYRAVSNTSLGGGTGAFTDIVLDLSEKTTNNTKPSQDYTTSSISTLLTKEGILVSISRVNGDFSVGYLEKQRQEDNYKSSKIVIDKDGNPVIAKPGVKYLDKDVNHGLEYRYRIVYHTPDGLEKRTDYVSEKFRFIFGDSELVVSARSAAKARSPLKRSVSLSTHIASIKTQEEDDIVKEATEEFAKKAASLEKSKEGAAEASKSVLSTSRTTRKTRKSDSDLSLLGDYSKYFLKSESVRLESEKDVVAIEVKRIDQATSEKTDVGIFMPGETFDDIGDVIPGRKYTYEFQEIRMDMQTYKDIVEKVSEIESVSSVNRGSSVSLAKESLAKVEKDLSNFSSKFLESGAIIDGTIRSAKSMASSPVSVLASSKIGEPVQIEVDIPFQRSKIINSTAKLARGKRSIIEWSIKKGLSKSKSQNYESDVDYFIIESSMLGQSQPAIICHGSNSGSGNFRSVHVVDNNYVGEITYFITPVYNDCTIGDRVLAGKVLVG